MLPETTSRRRPTARNGLVRVEADAYRHERSGSHRAADEPVRRLSKRPPLRSSWSETGCHCVRHAPRRYQGRMSSRRGPRPNDRRRRTLGQRQPTGHRYRFTERGKTTDNHNNIIVSSGYSVTLLRLGQKMSPAETNSCDISRPGTRARCARDDPARGPIRRYRTRNCVEIST